MTNIADFDFLNCQIGFFIKSECQKEEKLGIFNTFTIANVEFSPNIKIQDLRNDQNCSFISSEIVKFGFT